MTIEQVCLIVVLNLLVGIFIARLEKFRSTAFTSLLLVAMIIAGFSIIWRSLAL